MKGGFRFVCLPIFDYCNNDGYNQNNCNRPIQRPCNNWNSYDYYGSINIRKGNGQYGNNYNQFGSNNGCGGCGGVNYPEPYNYFDF